jgi:hypothetical protein
MAANATSPLTWYHKPFGRRVVSAEHPYFFISHTAHGEDSDARRRRNLTDVAGL